MERGNLSKDRISHWLNNLVLFFCMATVYYQVIFLVVPVRILMYDWNLTILSSILAVGGAGLFILDLLMDRNFLRAKNVLPLIAVLAVMCISTLVWREYAFGTNVKTIIWQLNQMLVIFPAYRRLTGQQWKRMMTGLYWAVCLFYVPAAVASLVQFFTLYATKVDIGGNLTRLGFQEGRLFGMFSGIYFSTVMVAIMMIASIYYAVSDKRRVARSIHIVFALLFGCYVVLSGTRSVLVGCIVSAAVWMFLVTNQCLLRERMKPLGRTLICLLTAICIAGVIYAGSEVVGTGLREVTTALNTVSQNTPEPEASQPSEPQEIETTEAETLPNMYREDVEMSNISNNRFTIWKDYLEVWTQDLKALILGYSPGGYMVAIREQYPDQYIVQHIRDAYPHMYAKDLIYDAHNGYLLVAVNTGVLGIIAVAAFLILCMIQVLPKVYTKPTREQYVLLSLLVLILVAVFFDSDLFYKCTSTSVTFWLLAGLMLKTTE